MERKNKYLQAMMLCGLMVFVNSCQKDLQGDGITSDTISLDSKFSSYEIIEIDVAKTYFEIDQQKGAGLTLDLQVPGHPEFKFTLERHKGADREKPEILVDGILVADMPAIYGMYGRSKGVDNLVILTISPEYLSVLVEGKNKTVYIDPLYEHSASAAMNQFIVYEASSIIQNGEGCGNEDEPHLIKEEREFEIDSNPSGGFNALAKATCEKPSLLCGANPPFYTHHGSNTTRVASAMMSHINRAARFFWVNSSSFYYDPYPSSYLIYTTPSAYFVHSNGSTVLSRWRSNVNSYYSYKRRTMNLMFCGHNVSGINGIAYTATACNNPTWAYGLVDRYSNNLDRTIAHEMGHMMGRSGHSTLTSDVMSGNINANKFEWYSRYLINNHWAAHDCTGNWTCY